MGITPYFKPPKVSGLTLKVWQRNWDVFRRTFKVNFIPPFLEPLLYLFALGFGLGFFVGQIEGIPYPAFIAPALISISVMNSAFFETTYGSFVRMYYQKTFDAIIATPLNLDEVIMGELLWGATRSFMNATIILLVVTAFGLVQMPVGLLILPFAFLGGFMFAAIGMIFTSISPNIDSLNYPTFLFITPMFLFSGTFFPMSILPSAIQTFAFTVLPLAHLVSIARGITLSNLSLFNIYNVVWITVVSAVLAIVSINLMKRRLIK
jgi:lipooligosaccharide transport system permease protein